MSRPYYYTEAIDLIDLIMSSWEVLPTQDAWAANSEYVGDIMGEIEIMAHELTVRHETIKEHEARTVRARKAWLIQQAHEEAILENEHMGAVSIDQNINELAHLMHDASQHTHLKFVTLCEDIRLQYGDDYYGLVLDVFELICDCGVFECKQH